MLREDTLKLDRAIVLLKSTEFVRSQSQLLHVSADQIADQATVSKASRTGTPASSRNAQHKRFLIAYISKFLRQLLLDKRMQNS